MKVLIVGSGKSGKSIKKLLKYQGYYTIFATEKEINCSKLNKKQKDRLFLNLSFIVTSPGVPLEKELFVEAKKRKIKVYGELDYASKFLKGQIIAVTGTNGKTTTVSLINHLLSFYSDNVFLGGNIGVPVSEFVNKSNENSLSVLEVSSFQLETSKTFHPKISVILNISEDHLNRHKTMTNYIKCKYKITKNQTEKDILILNADDEFLLKNPPKTKAKVYYFSTKKEVNGCYVKRNCIYFKDNQIKEKLISLSGFKLVGNHNVSNLLASILSVYLLTSNKELLKNYKSFSGVEHRIEFVKNIKGVSFYNDSKATNIDSTLVALKSFNSEINLILGGSDKGYDFDELFKKMPKNIKNIVVFGQTCNKIAFSAKKYNFKNIQICNDLKQSTKLCFGLSKAGDIVLLSPACASFDQFSNFEERGMFFKKIVQEIYYENSTACSNKKT